MGMTNEEIESCIQTLRLLENTFLNDHGIFLNDKHPDNIEKIIIFLHELPCEDCISREQTLKAFAEKCGGECACCEYNGSGYDNAENCKLIKSMPSVTPLRPRGEWIPVKWHIKTEVEEYEQYPEGTVMLDCPMPAEGEDVLITIKGKSGQVWVEKDIALKDEDGWYTDGGYEWVDDIIAWMPLPQPYKAESEDKEC